MTLGGKSVLQCNKCEDDWLVIKKQNVVVTFHTKEIKLQYKLLFTNQMVLFLWFSPDDLVLLLP